MSKFAKLFEIDDDQLLATIEEDDDGDPSVSYSTEISFTRIKAQLSFQSDESAQKFFDSIDDEMANDIYESLVQKYKEFCDYDDK